MNEGTYTLHFSINGIAHVIECKNIASARIMWDILSKTQMWKHMIELNQVRP